MIKCSCGHEFEPEVRYRHRIICGDCTDPAVVARLMGEEKAAMVMADPPYGMGKEFENDALQGDDLEEFNEHWISILPCQDDAIFVCFHSPRLFWTVLDAGRKNGWSFGRYMSLYKPNDMTFPWHGWLGVSESILLFIRGKPKFNSEKPSDTSFWHDTYVWTHKNLVLNETTSDGQKLSHPSIKPVPVCADLIWKTSVRGDLIYEPFGGVGTTIIAAEQIGRRCATCEIAPQYVAASLERLTQMGLEAKLVSDGQKDAPDA